MIFYDFLISESCDNASVINEFKIPALHWTKFVCSYIEINYVKSYC